MTTLATPARGGTGDRRVFSATLRTLGLIEVRRYAAHPLFLAGVLGTTVICALGPDPDTSSMLQAIVPAAAIGLVGIVVMWLLAQRSDTAAHAAGAVPVPEVTRTAALAIACLVPFTAGVAWWVWAMVTYSVHPPTPQGFPFGAADDTSWVGAVLFGLGPMACLGGPLLGLLVARWTTGRAAPAITVIAVVAITIVMQGVFDPLVRARVVAPWTYWGGPFGVEGDAERQVVLPGSPHWWLLYVACLNASGLSLALLHDRDRPRRGLVAVVAVLLVIATVACLLAMWTGIPEKLVNPLRS